MNFSPCSLQILTSAFSILNYIVGKCIDIAVSICKMHIAFILTSEMAVFCYIQMVTNLIQKARLHALIASFLVLCRIWSVIPKKTREVRILQWNTFFFVVVVVNDKYHTCARLLSLAMV